ncbi:ParA-like protein (plasmid) [Candidatus Trichorickettsia mobilis]|uniref:nucleotide-binding protein n=1 Tax=Candidatus Trichorickettsia mobilis TaxID=1346319 RepID=UPI002B25B0E2|nr:AAA family ATPase [Candidatus Trichorickettsia mobilis]WPY01878.1 ParA-like protein [Candidatus Trichorickettsia mobilis]
MIILFGGEKGGVGKTTLATNIAVLRTIRQPDTLLIDTDRQSTASFWCSVREETNITPRITSVQKYDRSVRTEITELNKKYKDIIVDAGGRDSPELRGALLVSNIAVFPLRPSQFDLWTLRRLAVLVETAREINENLEVYIAVNMASPNPSVKEIEEMRELVKEFTQLKMLKASIYERIIYRRAAISGMGVVEYKPEDPKAIQEVINLYEELYGIEEINNE